jgi:TolB-like protein/Tfp pilus assembly protein PilF
VKPSQFLAELKRRNVYKVAVAYAVFAWLIIQFATQVFPFFEIPNWAVRLIILLLLLGSPIALVLAWVYEITPEGLKRTEDVALGESIAHRTGRKLTAFTVIICAVALAVILFEFLRVKPVSPTAGPEKAEPRITIVEKSIAVLPFENLSDDKQNAYFADGVQDTILTYLAKISDLKVISRISVMQYRTEARPNLREIGRALGVAHVLEGSVQRVGDRVRVTAQLIDARTDAHLWADSYDRDIADVFAIQSEIAQKIAQQLEARISPSEKAAIERSPTNDMAAYDLYLRAKVLLNSTTFSNQAKESYLEAVRLLGEAIRRDSSFFLAYCELANAHVRIYFFGYDHTPGRLALAEVAVNTALRLRPNSGEAHLAMAQHLYRGYRDYARARDELALAKSALPNDPTVFELTGYIDRRQGNWEGSAKNLERALELDPRNLFILQQISISYQKLRRFAEQAAVLDRALALAPKDVDTRTTRAEVELDWHADPAPLTSTIAAILAENPESAESMAETWFVLALCKRDAQELNRALAVLHAEGISIDGVIFPRSFCEGLAARVRGDTAVAAASFAEARAQLEKIVREQPNYAQALCVLAMTDAALGYKEEALREGRRAIELLPVSQDSVTGEHMIALFGVTCAWTGEIDLACNQLAIATQMPGDVSYGQLKLHPFWDPLRGEARFEKIVASLAPSAPK